MLRVCFFAVFTINMHIFVICKKIFFFSLGLCSFTKADFLEPQSTHIDACAMNLIATCFGVIGLLSVCSLHAKQYVSCFFNVRFKGSLRFFVINFTNHFYNNGSTFLTIHFKHFDFNEWFDLNSNSSNLFERLLINDCFSLFLVDSLMYFYTL